ncbi:DUF2813 domain-containing protein [Clostridium botulinum]|nr:DUF2813 domain-containing protein [Clostridium botulinum]NFQ23754.1 DUF2813 domain-containing protein [Clostridium botulinum]
MLRFNKINIENFRNFLKLELDLRNKNVIFGLNDIGKTNFLCAIRFLLDRDFRKNGFVDSDYFQKDITKIIEITLEIDISQENDDDKKIFTYMKGAVSSSTKVVYIQLKASYSKESLLGQPMLYWGDDLSNLEDIPSTQSYYEIDRLFNVIYIDSSIQLENVFKKYISGSFRDENSLTEVEREKIIGNINSLNNSISELSNVRKIQSDMLNEYNNYRTEKGLSIAIRSEIEVDNISSKLTPYICYNSEKTYPTSGDGRRKILEYTLLSLKNKSLEDKKINIFLIEELENHLHRSMQLSLSHQLFSNILFKYMFLTTHSSLLVSQMDDVNLIKLFKYDNTDGKSYYYKVPKLYNNMKKKLNQRLADAIYADTVLLVEGPSERILFETILEYKCNEYEALGGYILEVDGINFVEYYNILKPLGINVIIKTDNDLKLNEKKREYNLLGLNRCLPLIRKQKLKNVSIDSCNEFKENKKIIQERIYDKIQKSKCELLRKNYIYLSRVDLENDLYNIIPDKMEKLVTKNNSSKEPVDYLQSSKMINMIELCNLLTNSDLDKIFKDDLFTCIKELYEKCNQ